MRYVTHYEEYPIYEPAEGGYYYTGMEVVESEKMSRHKAKAEMNRIWQLCEAENEENREWERNTGRKLDDHHYWNRSCDGNTIWKSSKYIGEGERYVLERRKGSETRGWRPYC